MKPSDRAICWLCSSLYKGGRCWLITARDFPRTVHNTVKWLCSTVPAKYRTPCPQHQRRRPQPCGISAKRASFRIFWRSCKFYLFIYYPFYLWPESPLMCIANTSTTESLSFCIEWCIFWGHQRRYAFSSAEGEVLQRSSGIGCCVKWLANCKRSNVEPLQESSWSTEVRAFCPSNYRLTNNLLYRP